MDQNCLAKGTEWTQGGRLVIWDPEAPWNSIVKTWIKKDNCILASSDPHDDTNLTCAQTVWLKHILTGILGFLLSHVLTFCLAFAARFYCVLFDWWYWHSCWQSFWQSFTQFSAIIFGRLISYILLHYITSSNIFDLSVSVYARRDRYIRLIIYTHLVYTHPGATKLFLATFPVPLCLICRREKPLWWRKRRSFQPWIRVCPLFDFSAMQSLSPNKREKRHMAIASIGCGVRSVWKTRGNCATFGSWQFHCNNWRCCGMLVFPPAAPNYDRTVYTWCNNDFGSSTSLALAYIVYFYSYIFNLFNRNQHERSKMIVIYIVILSSYVLISSTIDKNTALWVHHSEVPTRSRRCWSLHVHQPLGRDGMSLEMVTFGARFVWSLSWVGAAHAAKARDEQFLTIRGWVDDCCRIYDNYMIQIWIFGHWMKCSYCFEIIGYLLDCTPNLNLRIKSALENWETCRHCCPQGCYDQMVEQFYEPLASRPRGTWSPRGKQMIGGVECAWFPTLVALQWLL